MVCLGFLVFEDGVYYWVVEKDGVFFYEMFCRKLFRCLMYFLCVGGLDVVN